MRNDLVGTKAYIDVIRALHRLFRDRYSDGGWLPPGRKMAQRMGVSYVTYCKALNRMVSKSFARSVPKKGHYVIPKELYCHKVGFVIPDRGEFPFLVNHVGVADAIAVLNRHGLEVQIVQGPSPEAVYENAIALGVEGLLWFNPTLKAMSTVKSIVKEGDIPLLLLQGYDRLCGVDFGATEISYDYRQCSCARVQAMLARGHRRLLYIGDYDYAVRWGIADELASSGIKFTRGHCVDISYDGQSNALLELLRESGATGVIAEGNVSSHINLFETLSAIPDLEAPEVLIRHDNRSAALRNSRYPSLKILSFKAEPEATLGSLGAEAFSLFLQEGRPMVSRVIGFKIQGVKELWKEEVNG